MCTRVLTQIKYSYLPDKGITYPQNPWVPAPLPTKNPYPYARVGVLMGMGVGSKYLPKGYP